VSRVSSMPRSESTEALITPTGLGRGGGTCPLKLGSGSDLSFVG
jgi:hypothetical protein